MVRPPVLRQGKRATVRRHGADTGVPMPGTAHYFAASLSRRADIGVWRTHRTDIEVMPTFTAAWSLASCRLPFPARRDGGQLVDGIRHPVVKPSGEAGAQMRSAAAVLMSVRRGRGSGASGEVGTFEYSIPEQDAVDHQCIIVIPHIQIDMTIDLVP